MIIKRDIFNKIKKFIPDKEIIALVGLRQVGKTTILKEFQKNLKNSKYITLEDFETLKLFEENINEFIEVYVKNNDYLFIDEIQYSKNSGKNLKYISDTQNCKIFISGSSKSELAIHSLQYLVGRVIIFDIYPLTFKEFVSYKDRELLEFLNQKPSEFTFKKLLNIFEEYLQYGGYPEIVKENDIEKKKLKLKSIVETYILKEIKDILGFRNSFEYENILKRLALQDGGILNKSNLANELGINRNKVDEMINILEKTGIISVLRPLLKNKTKQNIKSPKVYIQDLGFKNQLIDNFNKLELRQDKGQIYESFVLSQLLRRDYNIEFWRLENESEVDFTIEKDGKLIGIEIKSKLNSDSLPKASKKFIETFKVDKILICNENIYSENKNIIFTNYLISNFDLFE